MELYTYYRSTSSYRVRIALALKGLDFTAVPVNLLVPAGGAHRQPEYLAINPQGRVPALRTEEGELLIQSPAIIEYLDERYPQAPLLSRDLATRAHERAVASIIGCDTASVSFICHPFDANLPLQKPAAPAATSCFGQSAIKPSQACQIVVVNHRQNGTYDPLANRHHDGAKDHATLDVPATPPTDADALRAI